MKTLHTAITGFRAWLLHRHADALLRRARRHDHSARVHRVMAGFYTTRSAKMRALARRIEAARG